MVWVVEVHARPATRVNPVLHLMRAELRQWWWLQPAVLAAGLGVWALLSAVTARVGTDARPEGVIFNYGSSLLLSVFPVLLAGPVLAGSGPHNRLGLWFGLPLDRRTANLARLLGPLIALWPAVLTWPLIMWLLDGVYGPVPSWVVVNTALLVVIGVSLSFHTSAAPFLVFAALPIQVALSHFVPGGRPLGDALAHWYASHWTTLGLLVAVAGLAACTLHLAAPRGK